MLPFVRDNVFLCGLSGSGKSTVARLLARSRESEVLDTDALVVSEAGMSIAEIFAREGERGFREREARAVAGACARSGVVVALGGGALERDDSLELVLSSGTLVFLDADDDVLAARVAREGNEIRPLLSKPGAIGSMRARRQPHFMRAALTIDTTNLTPEEVAEQLRAGILR